MDRLFSWFRPDYRQILTLVCLWALVGLTNLGGADLWDIDEGNNTEASREMRVSDNWVVPTFNYELRVDKPALINWLQILSGYAFGEGEFSARFPSALAGLGTILSVWLLGRIWLGGLGGLGAGVILATSPLFVAAMRFANPDSLLTCLVSWTLTFVALGMRLNRGVWWLYAAAVCSGLAMLAKGPIGLALPGAIILLTLIFTRSWGSIPWGHLPGALLVWLAVCAPWYLWVGAETKFAWHKGFFLQHNLGRFSAPMENHAGPFWYYIPVLLAGTFPFSTMLLLPFFQVTPENQNRDWKLFRVLIACWALVPLAVFSISRTKLPNYVLPAYPGLALALASGMIAWKRGWISPPVKLIRTGMVILAVTGCAVFVGLLIAGGIIPLGNLAPKFQPLQGLEWLAPAGVILAIAGGIGFTLATQPTKALVAVALGGILFTTTLGFWNGQTLNAHKAPKGLAAALPANLAQQEARIGTFDWFQPSLVFYVKRPVSRIGTEKDLIGFLNQPLPSYALLPATRWEALKENLPAVSEISRRPDFYRRCEVVLVANQAAKALTITK